MPELSAPNIIKDLELLLLCGIAGIEITSPGVWVDGVEGAELGEGPAVFAVPELLAGPEDETGCFLFLPVWFFEALKCKKDHVRDPLTALFLAYITVQIILSLSIGYSGPWQDPVT